MKHNRLITYFILAILASFLISAPTIAATYYVDSTNGNDSNTGTSEAAPWKTIAKVNVSTFNPADQILFKRCEIWKEQLIVPSSGSPGNPIAFGAYGGGNKPIITGRVSLSGWDTSGNWTSSSSTDSWYISKTGSPGRMWLDGTEYLKATSVSTISSTYRWYWESNRNRLYIYATEDPASFYANIEVAVPDSSDSRNIYISEKNYIMLGNIDFRGGNNCIELKGAQYITFNQCDIGRDAILGIRVTRSGETESNYGIISNCAIDSGYNFSYTNRSNATLEDGLLLRDGANNWSVRNNLFKNWGHASIMLISNDDAYTVNHNEFYDNEITAPDVSYCRAIGTEGQTVGDCQGNKFYRNYIHNLSQKTQILGNANEIYYNVFAEITNTSLTEAVGIDLQAYGSFICYRNKIYNNTFVNIEGPAVRLWVDGGTKDIENNEIINNIMFNCGYKSNIGQEYALWIDSDTQVKANTYKNNLMYTPGISHIVYYRGAERTISEFNSENGNSDDVVNNNIQIEPLFKDPDSGNLALQSFSPCIDAGIDVNLTQDFSGSPIPKGESVDIGAFEYQNLVRPRNFRIVFP